MKIKLVVIAMLCLSWFSAQAETVENLDINQYVGKWHQIATIPQSFSKDCFQNTTAEYEQLENGWLTVINSCEEVDGKLDVAVGRARVNKDFEMNSKLEVTFVKFFSRWIWAFGGDYWVINLAPDYSWSIVGNPDKDALWILARDPNMSKEQLMSLEKFIKDYGYDTCEIIVSKNTGTEYKGTEKLCEIM